VVGTIIDFGRHPFPNVPVIVSSGGTQIATVVTGNDGKFTVNNVPTPYDVSFIAMPTGGIETTEGWRYEGLTIDKPFLQTRVDAAWQYEYFDLTFTGAGASDTVSFNLGGPDYSSPGYTTGTETNQSISWGTAPLTSGVLHALRWVAGDPPAGTQYLGYGTANISADTAASGYKPVTVDVRQTVTASTISGTVTSPMSGETLAISLYLTFADNARIPLFRDIAPGAGGTFSFPTPAIPNATLSVYARRGDTYNGVPTGTVSRHALATNATNVALQLPKSAQLTLPVNSATLAKSATFSWAAPSAGAAVYVTTYDFYQNGDQVPVASFSVVTAKNQATIPTFPGTGFDIPNVTACDADQCGNWHVDTYSSFTSVDQATSSPSSLLDALDSFGNYSFQDLSGIDDRDMVRSSSEYRSFHF
jgi:hypothetical protein